VLEALVKSGKALSAYEIRDYCCNQLGYDLLPMSVYRILEFLENNDLVHRLNTSSKYIACSHITCPHDHEPPQFLICKSCHRVEEVSMPDRVIKTVTQATRLAGFQLASKQLEIDCYCTECTLTKDTSA
jgi:Fur family zinc uptake transcriptional regulator|tara:strand:+ start:706 stop:1092 length:387 start_codon:yes stop_codon:yes gene_type:complete